MGQSLVPIIKEMDIWGQMYLDTLYKNKE
ncbi:hypothetical protein [Companilactobacillus kimchii]